MVVDGMDMIVTVHLGALQLYYRMGFVMSIAKALNVTLTIMFADFAMEGAQLT